MPAFGTAANTVVSNALSGAVTITITANTHAVIVCVTVNSNHPVSSVTDTGGNGYTLVSAVNNGTGIRTEMWRSKVTASATSVTVSFGAKVTGVICVATYTGVNDFGLITTNTPGGTTTSLDISLNPCQAALSWAVAAMGVTGGGTLSASLGNLRTSNETVAKAANVSLGLNDRPGDGSSGGTLNMKSPELENTVTTTVAGTVAAIVLELRNTATIIKLNSVVDVTSGASGSLTSPSFPTTLGDEISVLVTMQNSGASVSTVTDTVGSTYTKITGTAGTGGQNGAVEIWAATSAATNAANAVTVVIVGGTSFTFTAIDWTGLASRGNTGTNSATSTTPSLVISTQDADNAIVCILGISPLSGGVPSATPTAGDQRENNGNAPPKGVGNGSFVQDNDSHTSAAVTTSSTLGSSSFWLMAGYELRTVTAAKVVPQRNLLGVGM